MCKAYFKNINSKSELNWGVKKEISFTSITFFFIQEETYFGRVKFLRYFSMIQWKVYDKSTQKNNLNHHTSN